MKFSDIKIAPEQTHFLYRGEILFGRKFLKVMKFHEEGLAPVQDAEGWHHIDLQGNALYPQRYDRAFGYYCQRAAVCLNNQWFHLDTQGQRVYNAAYAWRGNYQEAICAVRARRFLFSYR